MHVHSYTQDTSDVGPGAAEGAGSAAGAGVGAGAVGVASAAQSPVVAGAGSEAGAGAHAGATAAGRPGVLYGERGVIAANVGRKQSARGERG